jgi:hypothetical protein
VGVAVYGKQATRLGEALFLHFATPGSAAGRWYADVLELLTDPLSVVERGSVHQHGVGNGVAYVDAATGAGLAVDSWDAPVFSPVTAADPATTLIVPYHPLSGPVMGFAAVLWSNIYNTNFPLYSVDAQWQQRFEIKALAPSAQRARDASAAAFRG